MNNKEKAEHVIDNLMQQNADDVQAYIDELKSEISGLKKLLTEIYYEDVFLPYEHSYYINKIKEIIESEM